MAKLVGNIQITGNLDGVSFYKMKGCKEIIVRKPSPPSKQRINNDPGFARTRENKEEFKGVGKAGGHLRNAMGKVDRLADYNFQGNLNKVTKLIQKMDTVNRRGERGILYSQNRDLLKGFQLNQNHLFDTIVRRTILCTIDRENGTATVPLPALQRGVNLNLPWPTPRFRFVVNIGVCDDLLFHHTIFPYDDRYMNHAQPTSVETAWYPANKRYEGETVTVQIRWPEQLHDHSSLVVTIGIEFDMLHRSFGDNDAAPSGSAKILDLG